MPSKYIQCIVLSSLCWPRNQEDISALCTTYLDKNFGLRKRRVQWRIANSSLLYVHSKRDERQKFIRSKYIERHFHIPEESPDDELRQVMKNRPPGENEDDLFNDSAEVW